MLSWQQDWGNYLPQMILIWVMLGIISLAWLLVLHLIILHIYLIKQGITTYDLLFGPPVKNSVAPLPEDKIFEKTQ